MHKYKTHVSYKEASRQRNSAERIIAALILEEFKASPEHLIIAVGGPGGTGKSTFSEALAAALKDAAILALDDYKESRSIRQGKNVFGPHPEANKMDLMCEHIKKIKAGETVEKPVYNGDTGSADSSEVFEPKRYNILDGEVSTYRDFRDLVDFSIFIDADWKVQLGTRISRDIDVRGYSREKAITTFLQSNLKEFSEYGAESKNWADVHLHCTDEHVMVVESVSQEIFNEFDTVLKADLEKVDLSGLIVAVTTPFDEKYKIDQRMFIEHLEYLAHHGVRRILVNGTTGEFFSLSQQERKLLLKLTRRYFSGMVLFQAGSDALAQTKEEISWADEYGADAIVSLSPYYFAHAPEEGIIDYFNLLAEEVNVPFILYNYPKFTQNNITGEMLKQIAHSGIKDSSGDLSLISSSPRYYVGGDEHILEAHQKGGYGFVSGLAAALPGVYVKMEKSLYQDKQYSEDMQQVISSFANTFSDVGEIAKIKYAVSKRISGYPERVRLPLTDLSNEEKKDVENALRGVA